MQDQVDPIALSDAAQRMGRSWSAVRDWPSRYKARKVGTVGRVVYYDYWDLSTIDAMKNLGLKVLPTPEERDRWREDSRPARHFDAA
ncbi:hypothetical protein GCM10017673_40470 [Streptosporangium violaceochromogenes]|nr:hypothetical protein GCM10017673_40470 [Streptosporangium violaceochromogenes]